MLRLALAVLALALFNVSAEASEEALDCVDQPSQTAIGFTTICAGQQSFAADQLQGWSCENLWDLRSNILYTEGYCFQSERGKAAFDNVGCHAKTLSALDLNEHQSANVKLIEQLEKAQNCPAG